MMTARALLVVCAVASAVACACAYSPGPDGNEKLSPPLVDNTPPTRETPFAGEALVTKGADDKVMLGLLEKYGSLALSSAHLAYAPDDRHANEDDTLYMCPAVPMSIYYHNKRWAKDGYTAGGNFVILTNPKMKVAVVAFRGTDGLTDVKHDLSPFRTKFTMPHPYDASPEEAAKPERKCGSTQEGFRTQFNALSEALVARMAAWEQSDRSEKAAGRSPTYEHIIFTGHSLGGALSVIAATTVAGRFPDIGKRITTITFGAPQIGTTDFRKCFYDVIKHSTRVENRRDPVTELPLTFRSMGYTKVVPPCQLKGINLARCHLLNQYHDGLSAWRSFESGRRNVCFQFEEKADRALGYALSNHAAEVIKN